MDMNWKSLAAMLPVQPCDELKRDVLMGIYDMHDLGGDLILYLAWPSYHLNLCLKQLFDLFGHAFQVFQSGRLLLAGADLRLDISGQLDKIGLHGRVFHQIGIPIAVCGLHAIHLR